MVAGQNTSFGCALPLPSLASQTSYQTLFFPEPAEPEHEDQLIHKSLRPVSCRSRRQDKVLNIHAQTRRVTYW